MKIKTTLLLMMTGLSIPAAFGQDIHFSQFFDHNMVRNPALTGIYSGDYKIAANYRNQWATIGVPFQTFLATAESRIGINEVNDCLSYGFAASLDRAGSVGLTTIQLTPALNYNKFLEDDHDSYLSVGFSGGYIQRSVQQDKMTFASQYVGGEYSASNPSNEQVPRNQVHNWDLSAGVSFNSFIGRAKKATYYLGAAVYHITNPRESFFTQTALVNLKMKWSGQAGFSAFITEQVLLTCHANVNYQDPYREIVAGGLLGWRPQDEAGQKKFFFIQGGCFYRVNDAVIPMVKVDYDAYSFTFSYDMNTSKLTTASNGVGGLEVSLIYKGMIKKRELKAKMRCPSQCPRLELLEHTKRDEGGVY